MKPQVNALARFKARTSTRRTLQHQARQPSPYGPTSAAKTSASRQQVRQALRDHLNREAKSCPHCGGSGYFIVNTQHRRDIKIPCLFCE